MCIFFFFFALHLFFLLLILIVNIYIVFARICSFHIGFALTRIRLCIYAQLNNQLKILIGIEIAELACAPIFAPQSWSFPLVFIFIDRFLKKKTWTSLNSIEPSLELIHITLYDEYHFKLLLMFILQKSTNTQKFQRNLF